MINLNDKYLKLLHQIEGDAPIEPEIGIILGSGLGDFADKVEIVKSIPTNTLPDYPKSTVEGHKGFIHFAKYKKKSLVLFQGRIHFYEGYNISDCLLPVHVANRLGVSKMILTNAAGGINQNFVPGDLMLAKSFNSVNIKKELTGYLGLATVEQKNNLLNLPSPVLNDIIKSAALEEKIDLKEGVYILTKGPSYETPAEIKMYAKEGIDAVGMSTVHEGIYAAINGIEVTSISLITNLAAGISSTKLSHREVIETAELSKEKFEKLVKRAIASM